MANLTIVLDKEVLRRARIRALEQGTSVNALLRAYVESYSGCEDEIGRAMDEVIAIAEESQAASGGRTWTRDELHER
jgi:plasmid stability protein